MSSATFTNQDKLDALQSALAVGVLTQAEYDAKVAAINNPTEPFSLSKFLEGMLSCLEPVNWAKDFASIFNVRKIIIYVLIGGACYFWALRERIPTFNLGGQAYTIPLGVNNENLQITKAGYMEITDANGKVIKVLRAKDIPQINTILKPIGFQFKPIGVVGMGAGASGVGMEAGGGVSWFKVHQWEADSFITNKGLYPLGVSYRLEKFGSGNTSVGLAGGMGWKKDLRVLLYVRVAF